jgi:hypothetical protein
MVNVFSLDIGGVNTKAALLKTKKNIVKELRTVTEYFPIWRRGKEKLPEVLQKLRRQLAGSAVLEGIGVTMTAELSDVYWSKKEGINHILDCVVNVFADTQVFVLNVDGELLSVKDAKERPLEVAAANWVATGWMISKHFKDCIAVDVGSTTTSIIPIVNGRVAAEGKTDPEKLLNGELVYTGALRTNVATIVKYVPFRGGKARVSSELFATSGDVHLLLNHITAEDFTVETADGRGKTRKEAMARLARVVCADVDMLTEQEITTMAQFIYEKQVEQITAGLRQVYKQLKKRTHLNVSKIPIVVAGLARDFLARRAAEKAGFKEIVDLSLLLGAEAAFMSPCIGLALMTVSRLEGEIREWMRC